MARTTYHPDPYWSVVSNDVSGLKGVPSEVGNKDPYYRYKRKQFVRLLHTVDFNEQYVLEVGCGPGSNILEVWKQKPSKLDGVEVEPELRKIAEQNVPKEVEIKKTDGTSLPYSDKSFDMIFTAEVLQHIRSINQLKALTKDMTRVARSKVILFERVESQIQEDKFSVGRTLAYYGEIFARIDFEVTEHEFIKMSTSQDWCGPEHSPSSLMQRLKLPIAKMMDGPATRGLAKIVLERK